MRKKFRLQTVLVTLHYLKKGQRVWGFPTTIATLGTEKTQLQDLSCPAKEPASN